MNQNETNQQLMIEADHIFTRLEAQIENIQEEILMIDLKLEKLDRDDEEFFEEMKNKKLLIDDLKNAKLEKKDFINANLHQMVEFCRNVVEDIILKQESRFLVTAFTSSSFKQNYTPQNQVFSKFFYNSLNEKIETSLSNIYEQKQADILKNFGIGELIDESKLQKTIHEIFDQIVIQCDSTSVYFKRKWMPIDLIQNEKIGIKDKNINQWSNGKQKEQDVDAEFPYMIVGAVICKNIQIEGFKTDRQSNRTLARIQSDGDSSSVLIFKLQDQSQQIQEKDYIITLDPSPRINIKSNKIIGFILQPLMPFPQVKHNQRDLEVQKELNIEEITKEIKEFFESGTTEEEILMYYGQNEEINILSNWQAQIQQIIKKIKNPVQDFVPIENLEPKLQEDLPRFKDFTQKNNLKKRFLNEEQRQKDKDYTEQKLNLLYKGLKKVEIMILMVFYEENKIITDTIESVFEEEEKQFVEKINQYKQQNEQINFEELAKQLLIKKSVLENLYENIFEPLPLTIDAIIEEKREEIIQMIESSEQELLDYYQQDQRVSKIQRWKEQIKVILDQERQKHNPPVPLDIQDILDQKKDEIQSYIEEGLQIDIILEILSEDQILKQFSNWQEKVTELIAPKPEPIPEIPGMKELLQPIQNFEQKNKFIEHLKKGQHLTTNFHDIAKQRLYGVSGQNYKDYANYYEQYKCITNREDQILSEEKQELDKFKNENQQNDISYISQKTLIHPEVINDYYGIVQINQQIVDEQDKIKFYLSQSFEIKDILEFYSQDPQINRISKWKKQLEIFINEIQKEIEVPSELPQIQNYQQKQVLIAKIKSGQINEDFKMNNNSFKQEYQGLSKEIARKCFGYYQSKGGVLSNSQDEIMQEEINLCNQIFFQNYGENQNFVKMSYETLINQIILEQIYEVYKNQPVEIPKEIEAYQDDIIQCLSSEMEKEDILNHYEENIKDIQKIQNWKIFLNILIDKSTEPQNIVTKKGPIVENDIKPNHEEQLLKIKFKNFKQKKIFIEAIKKNEFTGKILPSQVLEKKYEGLTNEQIQGFSKIYDNNEGIISLRIEELFVEERKEIIENLNINNNFKEISQKFLVHEEVIRNIYNNEIFDDELLQIFNENQKNLNTQQIKEMLSQQHEEAKVVLQQIFIRNSAKYQRVIDICQNNAFSYLNENIISGFLEILKSKNQKTVTEIKRLSEQDPILLIKILSFFDQSNKDQIEQEQLIESDLFRVQEKETTIIDIKNNQDVLSVVVSALFIANKKDQSKAITELEQYQIFQKYILDQYNKEEKEHLINEFSEIEKQKTDLIQKYQNFEELVKKFKLLENNQATYSFLKMHYEQDEEIKLYKSIIENKINQDKQINAPENKNNQILQQDQDKNNEIAENNHQNEDQNNINSIQMLSETIKRAIILHKSENICEYKVFGEEFLNMKNLTFNIHLVLDSKNNKYQILNIDHTQIIENQINLKKFKNNNPDIYDMIQPWLQEFMGFRSFIKFIYNKKEKKYKNQNIQLLQNLNQNYQKYQENMNELQFIELVNNCSALSETIIFQEWYQEKIKTDFGKDFLKEYDNFWARKNATKQSQVQEKYKLIFPNPSKPLDLRDFNRLRGRKDKDELLKKLLSVKDSPVQFTHEIIQQIFGFINRRENLQSLIDLIQELQIHDQISNRFFISLIFQRSNSELKSRLIYYLSEYFSVPLIMVCQSSYKSKQQNLIYVPEIAFQMLEGIGIFNFGAGKKCLQMTGKSQMLNDIIFPINDFPHKAFEDGDDNVFSNGQIDVFFEKSFQKKKNIVIMDGQGNLNNQAFQSALKLTNIALINFNFNDFNDTEAINDLCQKVEAIKEHDVNIYKILIIRDYTKSELYNAKLSSLITNKKNAKDMKLLDNLQQKIDQCVTIKNLKGKEKSQRLIELKIMMHSFNNKIKEKKSNIKQYKFTKENYINLMKDDTSGTEKFDYLKNIFEKTNNFMLEIEQIKDNIFQEDALPVLTLKGQIRQKQLEIRNKRSLYGEESLINQKQLEQELENLKQILNIKEPTSILKSFHKIITDQNSSIILLEISKLLRQNSADQIIDPNKQKDLLIKKNQEDAKNNPNENKENIDKRNEDFQKQIDQINQDIYQKSISLEYFWRSLVYYLESDTQIDLFKNRVAKNGIVFNIDNLLKNGDCFELIDGENLEFKGQFIKDVIETCKKDKVIVVCVIGPQSSGKSTLMNFAFGTQFFTSTGRCTKGIYFTLQKYPEKNNAKVKWLLMLDTEGLQSPERIDDEYDRKIVLFAMLSANLLIINNKGEINAQMINTLKMCCLTFDMLKKFGFSPQIMYTYGQNDNLDKLPFRDQVQNLRQQVIQASSSPTIEDTSEQLLGYDEEKINVFGSAYTTHVIQKEESKGLEEDNTFKIGLPNFGVQTSIIFKKICDIVDKNSLKFFEIAHWLDESRQNWQLIDKYSGNINAFKNLDEYKNDQKVQNKMYQLWSDYLREQEIDKNDELKCTSQRIILNKILQQKQGYNQLEQKIRDIEKQNDKEKDDHVEIFIFKQFEKWKNEHEQRSITVDSIQKYKKDILAKIEVVKSDFKIKLRSNIKEEQMKFLSSNGIKNIQEQAQLVQKDKIFQQITDEQQKQDYIKLKFDECWMEQLTLMNKEADLEKIMQNYFNDLLQTFKVYNKFIKDADQQNYDNLIDKVKLNLRQQENFKTINLDFLPEFLIGSILLSDQAGQNERIFGSNNEMIFNLREDVRERIYNPLRIEEYIKLQELIQCTYTYYIISDDLQKDLDKKLLYQDIVQNLTIQKNEIVNKQLYNNYKEKYGQETVLKVDDIEAQKSYLQNLLQDFEDAGFILKFYNYSLLYTQSTKFSDTQLTKIFENYFFSNSKGLDKSYSKKRKEDWASYFTNNLQFNKQNYKKIDPRLEKYFQKIKIQIKHRKDPKETIEMHKKLDFSKFEKLSEEQKKDQGIDNLTKNDIQQIEDQIKYLKQAVNVQSEAVLTYQPTKQASRIDKTVFKTLIYPKTSENDMISKQKNLSFIAYRQIQWNLIANQIIDSVKMILESQVNIDSVSQSKENEDVDQVMELKQMSYSQIMTLEHEHLGSKLREKIDYELSSKLGLKISHEMSAEISWCALIVCWILLYHKAERTFIKQRNNFQKNYSIYFESFKQIIDGNLNSITQQNIKSIFQLSYKNLELQTKQQYKASLMNEITNIQNRHFQAPKIYQELDQFYFALQYLAEQEAFVEYVHNPVKIFEQKVIRLKEQNLNHIFNGQSGQIKTFFADNLLTLYNLIGELKNAKDKVQNWGMVGKYFKITDDQNKPLTFNQIDCLMNQISPIVYLIFLRMLDGEFRMNQFEYSLLDENGIQQDYQITPNSLSDDGPLEVFTSLNHVLKIKNILQNEQKNFLVNEFKSLLSEKQNDCKFQLNHIEIIIENVLEEIQKYLNINQNQVYNEHWFECQNQIDEMINQAVGCKSTCQFCNRKCELLPHNPDQTPHSCENVGHQLRVFAGAYLINKRGDKFPSLGTCDTIKPDSVMLIDGNKTVWSDVLANQMRTWVVNYKVGDQKVKENLAMFQQFWETVGKDYCKERGMIYDDKNRQIDQIGSIFQAETSVVIIALDESGSMGGDPWNDVVEGAKKLLEFLRSDHIKPSDVQIVIIFFNSNARTILDTQLSDPVDKNIWVMNGGGTSFGPPLKLAFQQLENYVDNKQTAKIYFFTDGGASYPEPEMKFIEKIIEQKNQSFINDKGDVKLEILLMCQDKNNSTMENIQRKFNEISQSHLNGDICKLLTEVDTSKVGDFMIESYSFAKDKK